MGDKDLDSKRSAQQQQSEGIAAFVQSRLEQFGIALDQTSKTGKAEQTSGLVKPDQIPAKGDARGMTVADLIKDTPVAQGSDIKAIERGKLTDVDLGDGRKYQIYVPQNAKEPMPVMMILHGANGGAADGQMSKESGMNKLAEEQGFAVVYPLSKVHSAMLGATDVATWNGPGKNIGPTDKTYNDFDYLDHVIKDVATQHGLKVDQAKFSAAGMSDGGRFINEYAQARPGMLSAIASVHGTLLGGEQMAKGLPALIIHSDSDYMLPYEGGRGFMSGMSYFQFPGVGDSKPNRQFDYWSNNDGCKGLPSVELTPDKKAEVRQFSDAQCASGPVKEYMLKGGKHAWDGKLGEGGWYMVGDKDPNFETSRVVADFLLKYLASGKTIQRDLAGQLK